MHMGGDSMTHRQILDALVECIADVDRAGMYGTGDRLMDIIGALKADWQTQAHGASCDVCIDD